MRFSGMPHRPKPPIMIVAPSGIRATASAALATTLFIASHSNKMTLPVHPDLEQAISSHDSIVAEVILLDEINRIPLKSQSAFLEGLQDRTVTVGNTTYELPAFSFAIATMNPVELGQGTFPLSEAATDRFAIMVNIGYLPPEEEQ